MSNNTKIVKIELYVQWPTNRKSYVIYRMVPFSMTLKYHNPDFKARHYLTLNISETVEDSDSYNGTPIGNRTRSIEW